MQTDLEGSTASSGHRYEWPTEWVHLESCLLRRYFSRRLLEAWFLGTDSDTLLGEISPFYDFSESHKEIVTKLGKAWLNQLATQFAVQLPPAAQLAIELNQLPSAPRADGLKGMCILKS